MYIQSPYTMLNIEKQTFTVSLKVSKQNHTIGKDLEETASLGFTDTDSPSTSKSTGHTSF